MGLLFWSYAAYVQLNDPRPMIWASFYGLSGILGVIGNEFMRVAYAGVALSVAGMWWKEIAEVGLDFELESGRTFGGAVLVTLWMLAVVAEKRAGFERIGEMIKLVVAFGGLAAAIALPILFVTQGTEIVEHCRSLGLQAWLE